MRRVGLIAMQLLGCANSAPVARSRRRHGRIEKIETSQGYDQISSILVRSCQDLGFG
jgi:hypothetical protein